MAGMPPEEKEHTIVCPQDATNHYYTTVCRKVFRTSEHRPWCRTCCRFIPEFQTGDNDAAPLPSKQEPKG